MRSGRRIARERRLVLGPFLVYLTGAGNGDRLPYLEPRPGVVERRSGESGSGNRFHNSNAGEWSPRLVDASDCPAADAFDQPS